MTYLARPAATSRLPAPWPGVVLVHDALGLGDDMREQADWLAAAGYLVAAPDYYDGRPMVRCVKGAIAQLHAGRGPVYDLVERTREQLRGDPECTGRIGVIGFCLGGGFALVLAGRGGWDAANANYGIQPDDLPGALRGACPVLATFGGRDRALPDGATRLRAAADQVGAEVEILEYPRARHAFLNRSELVTPLPTLLKVVGVGYDHACAADAKRRILAFFDAHLVQAVEG